MPQTADSFSPAARDNATAVPAPPLVASSALFGGGRQLRIAHAGQVYLLRITRENKLILTK